MTPPAHAIEVAALEKRYGDNHAVDGISLTIGTGEVFGLLGPNGAGKTTTVEILEGYRKPDGGTVSVLGLDPWRDGSQLRPRIGVMLQEGGLYPGVRPLEALRLFAAYYDDPDDPERLLSLVGLDDAKRTYVRRMSGGQQQRLSLALALVGKPSLVFLDEPTAGMDPHARATTWTMIRELRERGVTVVLTTHAMDEAEHLCDRVAIIDHGRVVACDTPTALTTNAAADETTFSAAPGLDVAALAAELDIASGVMREIRPGDYRIEAAATPELVAALAAALRDRGVLLGELRTGRRSLEDVFIRLTGDGRDALKARGVLAQSKVELMLTLRRGESLLVAFVIPLGVLVFFSKVDAVNTTMKHPVDFLVPGVLALAVMSSAMVSLGIATGFERRYGVLKRLGSTPLSRGGLLVAKTVTVLLIEAVQATVIVVTGIALGWEATGGLVGAVLLVLLGTIAFAGIGMLMAGTLRAEANLAAANGLFLVLLFLGGMAYPLAKLPNALEVVAKALPAAALSETLRSALTPGVAFPTGELVVLVIWAIVAPLVAARFFRWEE